jgi:hypothetical protein
MELPVLLGFSGSVGSFASPSPPPSASRASFAACLSSRAFAFAAISAIMPSMVPVAYVQPQLKQILPAIATDSSAMNQTMTLAGEYLRTPFRASLRFAGQLRSAAKEAVPFGCFLAASLQNLDSEDWRKQLPDARQHG